MQGVLTVSVLWKRHSRRQLQLVRQLFHLWTMPQSSTMPALRGGLRGWGADGDLHDLLKMVPWRVRLDPE